MVLQEDRHDVDRRDSGGCKGARVCILNLQAHVRDTGSVHFREPSRVH